MNLILVLLKPLDAEFLDFLMIISVSSMLIGGSLNDDCGFTIKFFKNMSSSYTTGVKLATIAVILTMK